MKEKMFEYVKANLGIDDKETFDMLFDCYAETVKDNIDKIEAALAAGDAQAVRAAAHALKGSSANIGAEEFRAACYRLECDSRIGSLASGSEILSQLKDFQKQL